MLRRLCAAALLAALSGCAALTPRTGTAPPPATLRAAWDQRVAQLSPIDRFVLQGRVANGALGFKADLRWKQFADGRFELRLSGPLGGGATELSGDARTVLVRRGDEQRLTDDPEGWLEQALGVRLPVRGLRWWALGLPAPDSDNQVLLDPASGRALQIAQDGWTFAYTDYRPNGPLMLPRRIEAHAGDARVLLLADRWSAVAPMPDNSAFPEPPTAP